MAKKKKTYKVSGKPKVAAMNEYIYNTLKDDLAKEYKVARPFKPKKIKKAQAMKGVTVTQGEPVKYKPKPKPKTFREAGKKYKQGNLSKGGKSMPTSIPKGVDAKQLTAANKRAGIGIGQPGSSKYFDNPSESQIKVEKQKVKNTYKGKQPLYKSGTSSPLNKKVIQRASKPLSHTAKKAVLARGAKLAAKGATRLIPGVGTAMLAKDVYNVLTKSEATKYVPQFGAKNVSKKYKKGKNY